MVVKRDVSAQHSWLLNDGSFPIQIKVVGADEISSMKHMHRTMHEYFYPLAGEVIMVVDGEKIRLGSDDLLVVEPGEIHHPEKWTSDLRLLLIMPEPVANDKIEVG